MQWSRLFINLEKIAKCAKWQHWGCLTPSDLLALVTLFVICCVISERLAQTNGVNMLTPKKNICQYGVWCKCFF